MNAINEAIAQLESVTQDNVSVANSTNDITHSVNKIVDDILEYVNKKEFLRGFSYSPLRENL